MYTFVIKEFQEFPSYPGRDVQTVALNEYRISCSKDLHRILKELSKRVHDAFAYHTDRYFSFCDDTHVRCIADTSDFEDVKKLIELCYEHSEC